MANMASVQSPESSNDGESSGGGDGGGLAPSKRGVKSPAAKAGAINVHAMLVKAAFRGVHNAARSAESSVGADGSDLAHSKHGVKAPPMSKVGATLPVKEHAQRAASTSDTILLWLHNRALCCDPGTRIRRAHSPSPAWCP